MSHALPDVDAGLREGRMYALAMEEGHKTIAITPHRVDRPVIGHATALERIRRPPRLPHGSRSLADPVDEVQAAARDTIDEIRLGRPAVAHHRHVARGHRQAA